MVWIGPLWCRNCMERIEICSTVPVLPPTSIYSPLRKASSIRKNTPEIISATRVCAPKPIASPITLAAAISGPMLTPRLASMAMTATTKMVTNRKPRKSGSTVAARDRPCPPGSLPAWASPSSASSAVSSTCPEEIQRLVAAHKMYAIATVTSI